MNVFNLPIVKLAEKTGFSNSGGQPVFVVIDQYQRHVISLYMLLGAGHQETQTPAESWEDVGNLIGRLEVRYSLKKNYSGWLCIYWWV